MQQNRLDGVYDCKANRKAIFNRDMAPNINENPRNRKTTKPGPKRLFREDIYEERFRTIERVFAYFSPSWTAFQADRGRDFSVMVDGISN